MFCVFVLDYYLKVLDYYSRNEELIMRNLDLKNTGHIRLRFSTELPHDKTSKMACAPSEDSDQPGRPPSLIRVFAVRTKKTWVLSYPLSAQRRLWSDWTDAQADLSLLWAHSYFVGFVMRRLKSFDVQWTKLVPDYGCIDFTEPRKWHFLFFSSFLSCTHTLLTCLNDLLCHVEE